MVTTNILPLNPENEVQSIDDSLEVKRSKYLHL